MTSEAFEKFKALALADKAPEAEYFKPNAEKMARQMWNLDPKMSLVFKGIGIGIREPDPSASNGFRDTPFASCPQI